MNELGRRTKDAGIARILTVPEIGGRPGSGEHAGMAIVVGRRHVLTCAHVLNHAAGRPFAAVYPAPPGPFDVAFPLSRSTVTISGRIVAWKPIQPRIVADIAVLELAEDVPADVGITVFADIQRSIDRDILNVFGIASNLHVGHHIEAKFKGSVGVGQSQIDGTGTGEGTIVGGFSGAAVWDIGYEAAIGMVRATDPASPNRTSYMVPLAALRDAWGDLVVEERRLPPSFNGLWTICTAAFSPLILGIFIWNRGPWLNDTLTALFGMCVYALVAPFIGLMWFCYAREFRLRPWSNRIPRFASFRADPGSRADKLHWAFSLLFLILLPFYAQGHFLKTIHARGEVLIYPSDFGYTADEIGRMTCYHPRLEPCGCWTKRSRHLCRHPEAGLYSFVTPRSPAKGGFWKNRYHIGEIAYENQSVMFLPILQPLLVNLLTALSIGLFVGALWRTFGAARRHIVDREGAA